MAIGPRLGSQNLLVRRVLRHRSVATLFRSGAGAAAGRQSPPATEISPQVTRPARRAVVVDTAATEGIRAVAELASPPVAVVTGQAAPAPDSAPEMQRGPTSGAQARVSPRPVSIHAAGMTPARPVSERQREPTPPREGPAPEAPAPAATAAEDTTLTEQVWRRLQTIFRRHQEAQPPDAQNTETLAATGAALQTTPGTPEPGTAEQAASAGPQPPPAVAATTERPAGPDQAPSTGATPAREDPRQSGATEPATATPDIEAGTIAARDEVMGSLPEPGAVSTDQAPGPVAEQPDRQRLRPRGIDRGAAEAQEPALSAARPTAREVPSAAPQADRPAADREREEPDSQAVPRTAIQPEGEPSIETRTAAPPLRAGLDQIEETSATLIEPESPRPDRMPGITDEGTVPRQPPLEEVWQVERVPLSRRRQPVTPPAQATGALASAGVQRPRDAERHAIDVGPEDGAAASRYPTRAPTSPAEAGAVLQRVAAARTTSSSIETIPPRRPRPARRPEPETTAPPPRLDVQPASDATRPPAPETRLATEQMEASGPSQRVPEDRGALIQRPEVQRPQGSVAGTGTPAIPVVTTEIGPLPSDLWELIGEQPPETPERSAAGEPAILRAVPQARPATGSQATPLIQRAAMATTAQAPTVSVPADGDAALAPASAMQAQRQAEPEAETAQAAVDLEKLAQRVYAELKRRLMVEWERLRGP